MRKQCDGIPKKNVFFKSGHSRIFVSFHCTFSWHPLNVVLLWMWCYYIVLKSSAVRQHLSPCSDWYSNDAMGHLPFSKNFPRDISGHFISEVLWPHFQWKFCASICKTINAEWVNLTVWRNREFVGIANSVTCFCDTALELPVPIRLL